MGYTHYQQFKKKKIKEELSYRCRKWKYSASREDTQGLREAPAGDVAQTKADFAREVPA